MLEMNNICKSFSGIQVLKDVALSVKPGQIHALVGENGAGKSTLIKTIAGVFPPSSGTIQFGGHEVNWASPGQAKAAGIHVIYQEFILFPHLSVAENIFIGNERKNAWGLLDRRRMNTEAQEILHKLGVEIDPTSLAGDLSVADQQMVEIAKAMAHKVQLLVLDEPTAVISGLEVELLFKRLRHLRNEGVAIVYVSHRMEELFELCDQVTVIKDGALIGSKPISAVTQDSLIAMMVGRSLSELFPPKRRPRRDAKTVLKARGVRVGRRVKNASIELRSGEVTALAGMIGSGRTELAMAIFGGLEMDAGEVFIDGRVHARMTPLLAIEEGIGLVPESRKTEGLAMLMDVAANMSAAGLSQITRYGLLDKAEEARIAAFEIGNYRIACRGGATPVAEMSGGNQQKVLLARWARQARRVLILDEPTRGVDVGAKAEIYRVMHELAERGLAILMISSELLEVVGMADRVYVMREGEIAGELGAGEISEEAIMGLATRNQGHLAPQFEQMEVVA